MRLLGRMVLVLVAFAVAAIAAFTALVVLASAMLETAVLDGPPEQVHLGFVADYLAALILLGPGILITTAVTVLAVIVGEVARIRSWIYYVLLAGAAFAATPVLAAYPIDRGLPNPDLLTTCASAGFIGGFIYWLIAGRSA